MLGQISVEHTVLLLIGLALLLPITSQFTDQSFNLAGSTYKSLIEKEGNQLVSTIERSANLGENSRQTVTMTMPDNFINATVEGNNTIIINVKDGSEISQYVFKTTRNIQYDEVINNLKPGKQNFYVTTSETGVCLSRDGFCGSACGNNRIDVGELCDSNQVNTTCGDLGYLGGVLLCNSTCTGYILDYCQS